MGEQPELLSQSFYPGIIPRADGCSQPLPPFIPSALYPLRTTGTTLGLNPTQSPAGRGCGAGMPGSPRNPAKFHGSAFSCLPAPEKTGFLGSNQLHSTINLQSSSSGAPTNEFLNPVEKLQLRSRNYSPPKCSLVLMG